MVIVNILLKTIFCRVNNKGIKGIFLLSGDSDVVFILTGIACFDNSTQAQPNKGFISFLRYKWYIFKFIFTLQKQWRYLAACAINKYFYFLYFLHFFGKIKYFFPLLL